MDKVPIGSPDPRALVLEGEVLADTHLLYCTLLCLPPSGDGNEAIGALIQNYIREIEELR